MPGTDPTGARSTENATARKYDMKDTIGLLDVNRYPLLAILTNAGKSCTGEGKSIKKKETTDPHFKWYEDTFGIRSAIVASGTFDPAAGGTFTVTTPEGNYFQAGDIVLDAENNIIFEVTSVTATTVVVGIEIGTASGIGSTDFSGDTIWIIGNANEEGARLRAPKGTTAAVKSGYCQIFRLPFGVTETAKNTQTLIKENDFDYQRRKKAIEHAVDIERAFIFSKASGDTAVSAVAGTKGNPMRTTAGVLEIVLASGAAQTLGVDTEAEFETWLESAFLHGNCEKYLFASAAVVSMINGWAKGKLEILSKEKTYGLNITRYISPHGTVNIIKHPLLTGTPYGNYAVMIDMEMLTYRYLSNRDTKLLTNRQARGDDERIDEYLTECGLMMEQALRHAMMTMGAALTS